MWGLIFVFNKILSRKVINIILILLIALGIYSIYNEINGPRTSSVDGQLIDLRKDPIQTSLEGQNKIYLNRNGVKVELIPLAKYSISAKVKSKENYYVGWGSKISPEDFALAWGNLNDIGIDKFISYSQNNRWYYFRYNEDCPVDEAYISKHSSNNHIIPADDNVLKAVKKVKKGDTVKLQGYLVNVEYQHNGEILSWNSSVSREDTGDGACEVFYVNEVRIGNRVYK